uniref:Uncharacterized protein n=1 Tax=Cucumis melo TaxID=3656 RepID=A0A9I9EMA7_CUCME
MDSTDMELECDGSCKTSKIVRDEDTDVKRKTIDVDSYGREDVPNPSKIRKNVKQSMIWDLFERLKEGCREALVEMIIVDELPIKFVDGKGFKKFVDKLTCGNHTRFVVPSRFTVARDVLKFYVNEKNRLRDMFRILSFCPIENHKGDTIGKTIEKNLKD